MQQTCWMPFCCQVHLPLRYHSKADTAEAKGNSLADHVAKTEALQNENKLLSTASPFQPPRNLTDVVQFQGEAPENRHLDAQGGSLNSRAVDTPRREAYPSL